MVHSRPSTTAEDAPRHYEVVVVRAVLPHPKAVLCRVFVNGEIWGTTSKRRRVAEPVWDRAFARKASGSGPLFTKLVFAESTSGYDTVDVVATCVVDGAVAMGSEGKWRGWVKAEGKFSLLRYRARALVEVRLVDGAGGGALHDVIEEPDLGDRLVVTVHRARALARTSRATLRRRDPYARVWYGDAVVGVTAVEAHTLGPEWGDVFRYALAAGARPSSAASKDKKLVVEVYDKRMGKEDAFLGAAVIPGARDLGEDVRTVPKAWYRLGDGGRDAVVTGDVEVSVEFDSASSGDEEAYFAHFAGADLRALRLLGALFDELDVDGDGQLDNSEFRSLYARLSSYRDGSGGERADDLRASTHLPFPDATVAGGGGALTFEDARRAPDGAEKRGPTYPRLECRMFRKESIHAWIHLEVK